MPGVEAGEGNAWRTCIFFWKLCIYIGGIEMDRMQIYKKIEKISNRIKIER